MLRRTIGILMLSLSVSAHAQETYKKPPKEILDVLNAPATPVPIVSPAGDAALMITPRVYSSIADMAQPVVRVAGLRISAATNGPHAPMYFTAISLMKLPGGAATKIVLPPGAKAGAPQWSPDGRRFAFTNTSASGLELWVGALTGAVRRLGTFKVNGAVGSAFQWMPDGRTLLVRMVPAGRGKPPQPPAVPSGPNVQESYGKGSAVWTFQDLLKTPYDEALLDYYATAQLAFIDSITGAVTPAGKPGIFQIVSPAPDGKHILVARVHRPYSYLYTYTFFPKDVEVWDRAGKVVHTLAKLPLQDAVPVDGVPTGPRSYAWNPVEPATLVWVEALDGGDPKTKVPHRDRILSLKAPFTGEPQEFMRIEQRYAGLEFFEEGGYAFVSDYERERRWIRTWLVRNGEAPNLVWSRDSRDAYKNPGEPVTRILPTGHSAVMVSRGGILLDGTGATPEGDRPFVDRLDLRTLKTERLFQSAATEYETAVAVLDRGGKNILTRFESPTTPPNYALRADGERKPVTAFPDPAPSLKGIRKQLVKYKRPDGVPLSFTLYLPPNYKEGTRLPTVVWAYPLEYNDPSTAGQVVGSPQRFTMLRGMSHLFYLLRGYAVLDSATMPVVGDFKTVNDTYINQVVASAKAAIDKATEMGVTDPNRVGVGGHSYGAFMTANLLAHSDLFRAGVARSGAYNRTLTPFGFQSERRTFWEARDTYMNMSPFSYADKIKEPILLIHGEADNNPGTFPVQSDRMYQAIRGNGGSVRLVFLPHESHGYMARESIEHVLWEMMTWFDRHVKDAPPRTN